MKPQRVLAAWVVQAVIAGFAPLAPAQAQGIPPDPGLAGPYPVDQFSFTVQSLGATVFYPGAGGVVAAGQYEYSLCTRDTAGNEHQPAILHVLDTCPATISTSHPRPAMAESTRWTFRSWLAPGKASLAIPRMIRGLT